MKYSIFCILLLIGLGASANASDIALTNTSLLIGSAAEAAPDGVEGDYVFVVKAAERLRRKVYLNTQLDYRDQRNISIVLDSSVVAELNNLHGVPAEELFKQKTIEVSGIARRKKINFYCDNAKTGKYYYQTQIEISNTDQINNVGSALAAAKNTVKKSAFEKDVEKYLSYKNYKAYALALGEKGGWVSGYGYNFDTQEQADERALLACEKRRNSRELKGICKIRARGDIAPQMPWGNASYTGCNDPKYAEYVASRLAGFESNRKNKYQEALQELTVNPYDSLNNNDKFMFVRQNTVLSARFDTEEVALENIRRLNSGETGFRLINRIDGDIPHLTNTAKGWLALNRGDEEQAIHYLLESTNTPGSPVLGSFGPETSLVSELYMRGHKDAVLEYLKRSDEFWNTDDAMEKKAIWRVMIENGCPVQFQFYDTTNFKKLGLSLSEH